ncbi:HAD family phosphatase [Streptomyces sp. NPDC052042]|uniref:HAD family phosphatase n=1 Tax=Streptomyces sp. NPDC052042 TaxID=3365683 RepID=UPI0037CCD21D
MVTRTRQIRLVALNIDGVLLNDTFSPVIHGFLTRRGATYTADVERRIFSQPRHIAAREIAAVLGLELGPGRGGGQCPASGSDSGAGSVSGSGSPSGSSSGPGAGTPTGPRTGTILSPGSSPDDVLAAYFEERAEFLDAHPVRVTPGAIELVRRARALGLETVCYGGLEKGHFDRFLGEFAGLFDGPGYICTDAFRPGIHEIATEFFGLEHDQVLVVDDVARVAEAAKSLNMPFIGHPSSFEHSFQRQLMREVGTRHIVGSLDAIDDRLLRTLDEEAAAGTVWRD